MQAKNVRENGERGHGGTTGAPETTGTGRGAGGGEAESA